MAAGDVSKAILAELRRGLGQRATLGLLDQEGYDALNYAQYDLGHRLVDAAMPEATSIVTSTLTASKVALPADFWRERLVLVGTKHARQWPLGELVLGTVQASLTDPMYYLWGTTGVGYLFCEVNDPASAAAYTLYYVKQPTAMSDSTDPVCRASLYDLLVSCALWQSLKVLKRYGEAAAEFQNYLLGVAQVNARYRGEVPFEAKPR